MKAVNTIKTLIAAAALLLVTQGASALTITSGFTGAWYDPGLEGQGFDFTVLKEQVGTGRLRMLAYWYTFDPDGNQLWALGDGLIENDTVTIQMNKVVGASFPDFDPSNISVEPFGSVTVTFDTCNSGFVDYALEGVAGKSGDPKEQVGTGRLSLARITQVAASQCTGGISDNVPNDANVTEFTAFLNSTGSIPGASGRAEFEERVDRVEFKVEIEDVPNGDYDVVVDGQLRGVITVAAAGQGEVEFRSPVEPGKILLDFDPRGKTVDVELNGMVVLTSDLPNDGNGMPVDGNPPPFGNAVTFVDLNNSGADPDGSGDAELEQRSDRVEFDVEIEDVTPGAYELYVGGELRASILVMTTPSGPEGEVEFRYPVEAGKELLDFDPRGQMISVRQGPAEYFNVLFPSQPNGGDGGGGGGDGGGGGGSDLEIRVDFINTGSDADASGDVRYREDSDGDRDFKVEAEDLPDGNYNVVVGGVTRATLSSSGGEGEVEFSDPVEPGDLPLTFDPRGMTVSVSQGATVFLTVDFPSQ